MAAQNKSITVLARYFVRLTFAIVYLVRNGSGREYLVTLNANGTSGCVSADDNEQCTGCKYGHKCYHKVQVAEIETKRTVLYVGDEPVSGVNADHAVEKALRLLNARAHAAYDVVASAEEVAAAVDAPQEETEVSQNDLPPDCPTNEIDMTPQEHHLFQDLAKYERSLDGMSLRDLLKDADRHGLQVADRRVKAHVQAALIAHKRAQLEKQHFGESTPVISALSVLPQAPTFESRDLAECGTLNRPANRQGFSC